MSIDLNDVRVALTHLPLPGSTAEFNAILAADHHRREHDQLLAAGDKVAILAALAAAGVAMVTASYDGYGDSGQFEKFMAILTDGASMPLDKIAAAVKLTGDNADDSPRTISGAVETYCYDLLEVLHDGYENNDGAYGEFVFDVAAGTVQLTHNDRYTAVDTTEHAI